MNNCNLEHVPQRLHWNDKPAINEFYQDEKLYLRCKKEQLENPFSNISLRELSINRQGPEGSIISIESDVLINIEDDRDQNQYVDKEVCVLEVKKIDKQNKTYYYKDSEVNLVMILIHDPLACNYAHSLFRIIYYEDDKNGEIIGNSNYNKIAKTNKTYSNLRTRLRHELKVMIINQIVKLNA